MIIHKKTAETIDRKGLAEMATNYANMFIEKLGSPKRITIGPEQICSTVSDAEKLILEKMPRMDSIEESIYQNVASLIAKRNPFFFKKVYEGCGVIYSPLRTLDVLDNYLVNRTLEERCKAEIVSESDTDHPYLSFDGFGSEIGHLVSATIYNPMINRSLLRQLPDVISMLYEISTGIRTVWPAIDEKKHKLLEKELIDISMVGYDTELKVYEAVVTIPSLLSDDKLARQALCNRGCNSEKAESRLQYIKRKILNSDSDIPSIKILREIYRAEGKDIDKTCKKVNEILSSHDPILSGYHTIPREEHNMYKYVFIEDPIRRGKSLGMSSFKILTLLTER